jgi:hypothetical protein
MTSIICLIIKREKIKWDEEKSGLSRKSKDYKSSYGPMDSRSNLNPA